MLLQNSAFGHKRMQPLLVALALGLGLLALPWGSAQAQFEVVEAEVEEGALEVEAIGAYFWGYEDAKEEAAEEDEELPRQGYEFAVGYGITEFWLPQIGIELEQARGDSMEVSGIAFENTFAMPEEIELGDDAEMSLGVFAAFELSLDDDEAHVIEFGPIVGFEFGDFETTFNPFFAVEVGDEREDGLAFEYAWQGRYNVLHGEDADFTLGLGVEVYGEIEDIGDAPGTDEQEHRAGPAVYLGFEVGPGEIGLDTGLLFGLTDATSDYAFKWNLEYEIEF